jgi:hypothetical protein
MDTPGAQWRKSTHSALGNCVEVAQVGGQIAVRSSNDPGGPVLVFDHMEWRAFLDGVRGGEFDP